MDIKAYVGLYSKVLAKCKDFEGRAERKEYWIFFLINVVAAVAIGFVAGLLHLPAILSQLVSLAIVVVSAAVAVRRMHDTNRSGWWVLAPFLNIYFMCLEGDPGENKYGPNPNAAQTA